MIINNSEAMLRSLATRRANILSTLRKNIRSFGAKTSFPEQDSSIKKDPVVQVNKIVDSSVKDVGFVKKFINSIKEKNSLGLFSWRAKVPTAENVKRRKILKIVSSIEKYLSELEAKLIRIKQVNQEDILSTVQQMRIELPALQKLTSIINRHIDNLEIEERRVKKYLPISDLIMFFSLQYGVETLQEGFNDMYNVVKTKEELEKE